MALSFVRHHRRDARDPHIPTHSLREFQLAIRKQPTLDDVIAALERLMKMFDWERKLYLAFGVVSLFIFLFAGYKMLSDSGVDSQVVAGMLGATGVAAACSARVVYFLTRAFGIVEQLLLPSSSTTGDDKNGN